MEDNKRMSITLIKYQVVGNKRMFISLLKCELVENHDGKHREPHP